MAENRLVVANAVRSAARDAGCNCGGDFADALSSRVSEMVRAATARAQANGRKTVQARDL
jgi:histone H3/H4